MNGDAFCWKFLNVGTWSWVRNSVQRSSHFTSVCPFILIEQILKEFIEQFDIIPPSFQDAASGPLHLPQHGY